MGKQRNTKLCPKCKQREIMTGDNAKYNGKLKNGDVACPDCIVEELIGGS